MNLQQLSRLFVSVILFFACIVLVLLAQAQSGGGADLDPNKCYSEWDFCNAGSEAENAYHWRLGWCVAAVERGAISVSVSACMGQEEGSVSYPRSSSSSSSSAVADDNKCYTEWDFCNSGSEAENAYFWRLGWCASALERGALSGSLDQCMTGEEPKALPTSPPPDETQDDPWSRALCYTAYPDQLAPGSSFLHICGWDATLPPGMECFSRRLEWPWDCIGGYHVLSYENATATAAAIATATAGG